MKRPRPVVDPHAPEWTTLDVAARLRISDQAVRDLASSGRLPCVLLPPKSADTAMRRARRIHRFVPAAIEAWLAEHSTTAGVTVPPAPAGAAPPPSAASSTSAAPKRKAAANWPDPCGGYAPSGDEVRVPREVFDWLVKRAGLEDVPVGVMLWWLCGRTDGKTNRLDAKGTREAIRSSRGPRDT